jgi:uncharacterized damage-inducible protein DinB
MPVPASIAIAAVNFHQNDTFLRKNLEGLADEEWLRRPGGSANHLMWIVGHLSWARSALLKRLGHDWSHPSLALSARGAKPEPSAWPTPQEALAVWSDSCARVAAALESVTEEALAVPSTQGPPSHDGKVSGVVNFLAYHETYHLGQISYIRSWLGHPGVMG